MNNIYLKSLLFTGFLFAGSLFPARTNNFFVLPEENSFEQVLFVEQNSLMAIYNPVLPEKKQENTGQQIIATVTAYNNFPNQTWGNPNLMASGKWVYEGAIACPAWLPFGTIVEIQGKQYICEDRLATRFRTGNYFDIFMFDYQLAREWGRRQIPVTIYKQN